MYVYDFENTNQCGTKNTCSANQMYIYRTDKITDSNTMNEIVIFLQKYCMQDNATS